VSAQRFALRRLLDTKAVTLEMTAADVTASELVEPAPSDAPAAPVEFDIGDIPEDLRRTPAPAVEDYQPPDFVKAAFAQGGAA